VNRFEDGREPPSVPAPDYSALEREQVARLQAVRARRDARAVERSLASLGEAARAVTPDAASAPPLMRLIIDAVRVRASVGEISDTLTAAWGRYRPPV
jgi:methylmalonyl-CoA mutase N-terminal domain/subunit